MDSASDTDGTLFPCKLQPFPLLYRVGGLASTGNVLPHNIYPSHARTQAGQWLAGLGKQKDTSKPLALTSENSPPPQPTSSTRQPLTLTWRWRYFMRKGFSLLRRAYSAECALLHPMLRRRNFCASCGSTVDKDLVRRRGGRHSRPTASIGEHPWPRHSPMALAGRRCLYDLLRLRASPSVKVAVEDAMQALTGLKVTGPGQLSSGVSSKTLLLRLSRLLESLRHPFDDSPIRVCIVDFLATMGLGRSQHSVVVPGILEDASLALEGDYDVVVVHGADVLPHAMESDWVGLLESVLARSNTISVVVDAVHHAYAGARWDKTDRRIVVLKRPARAQNLLWL